MQQVQWQNRAHFFAMAARLMRRILVDAARARGYQKRGGGAPMLSLDEALIVADEPATISWRLTTRLTRWRRSTRVRARWWRLRFFGGLSIDETAEALQVSRDTVKRDWKMAKLWLLRELEPSATHDA